MIPRAADLLRTAVLRLKPALGEGAARDARVLLADALGIDPGRLILVLQDEILPEKQLRFEQFIEQRFARQPVSQIIGRRFFWGREFLVTEDVLDPRPETETLIELALRESKSAKILDLGLGTGCILLTILSEFPESIGLGADVSNPALAIARQNADRLGVAARVEIIRSDWFDNITGIFDLIVSNPPYITHAEMAQLQPEVADWEPELALTPGADGLGAYRKIAMGLDRFLNHDGVALFEIGRDQGFDVTQIFQASGFGDVTVFPDMGGQDRVVRVRR